jgi:DNA-binding Xre family transcriptional regulator
MSKTMTRIRVAGHDAASVRDLLMPRLQNAQVVGEQEPAELVVMTIEDFAEALEDAAAEAAYRHTRGQESIPDAVIGRLLAGELPLKVWREHRGLGLNELAAKAGVGRGYLSQIENGMRKGTAATLRKLAAALGIEIEDLMRPDPEKWGE